MCRTDDGEVATVQCCNLVLIEAFQQSKDACIYNAEIKISVRCLKLTCASQITVIWPLDSPGTRLDVLHEAQPRGVKPKLATPVVEFGQNESGNN